MKNSEGDARRWLAQADVDLDIARLALEREFFAHACFMSQQVDEKALAYYRGDRYVTGHSLLELLGKLTTTFPQLSKHKEFVGILDQYYVLTRYPDALAGGSPFEAYGLRQAKEAVEGTGEIVEAVRSVINE